MFETRNDCKSFWKKCVENHGFFRCFSVKRLPRQRTKVLSRGSSFRYKLFIIITLHLYCMCFNRVMINKQLIFYRYSGKTQKQMVEFVRENFVKRQTFQRYVCC